MSPHRLFRSPTAGAALLRSSRPLLHHRRHRFGLCVVRLEDRTLLSGPSGDVLAAVAPKIELGTPTTDTLAPGEVAFFQIDLHVPAGTPAAQRASFRRDVIPTDPALTVLRRQLRSIEPPGTATSAAGSASAPSNERQSYAELGTTSGPREGAR